MIITDFESSEPFKARKLSDEELKNIVNVQFMS